MIETLKILASLMNLPAGRLRSSLAWAGQPLLTALLIASLYAAQFMIRERSIVGGFKTAFISSDLDIVQRRQMIEAAELQADLRTAAIVNHVVETEMSRLLKIEPAPARVRLTSLHNGIANLTGSAMLRADITNGIARPGRATGGLSVNLPIGSVASFSPELLQGNCFRRDVADLPLTPGREHLESFGAWRFWSCPVSYEGQTMGILTVYWDRNDAMPNEAQEKTLLDAMKVVADKISAALSLRTRPPTEELRAALEGK